MRIGIVSQWFDPEPGPASLPGELARELLRRGHQVQVLTAVPNYPSGEVYPGWRNQPVQDDFVEGLNIRRVGIWPSHDSSPIGRVANYTTFGLSAWIFGAKVLRDCDVVWVSNSPPTVGWLVSRLRRHGVPIVLHVMDLWPDNVLSSGMVSRPGLRKVVLDVIDKLNSGLYSRSERILTISPGVGSLLENRGARTEKLAYAPLWANEAVFRPSKDGRAGDRLRREFGVREDKIVLLYAGAIGEVQGLDQLLLALERLPDDAAHQLECWIIGDGVWLDELKRRVNVLPAGSPRVRVLGRRPMEEMPDWFEAADICYVGLKPDNHATYSMPSKVQTILAMGRPILAAVPGDVNELIVTTGVGFSTESKQEWDLSQELHRIAGLGRSGLHPLGIAARQVYVDQFSRNAGVTKIESSMRFVERSRREQPFELVSMASEEDLQEIVDIHLRSFPDFFLSSLGPSFLRILYSEFISDPAGVLLVARRNGRIVGSVGGVLDERSFFTSLKARRSSAFARAALVSAARRPWIIPRLWRARSRADQKSGQLPAATLLTISVEPAEQGTGISANLLRRFDQALLAQGVHEYTLTTDARDTNRALGFYSKHGFTTARKFTTPEGRHMVELLSRDLSQYGGE